MRDDIPWTGVLFILGLMLFPVVIRGAYELMDWLVRKLPPAPPVEEQPVATRPKRGINLKGDI